MDIITVFDYVGTLAFAISGIRLAAAKQFDLFGAYVVGLVTAVGGGSIRDLLLDVTPFWMTNPSYVLITAEALLFVVVFKKYVVYLNNTFFIFDAIGIGLFTVVGLERSMAAGFPWWVNVAMGGITGAAGGVLRDIFINEVPLIFRKDIYAMACLGGGLIYYMCHAFGLPSNITQVSAAVSVFTIRILAVHFKVSLPALSSLEELNTEDNG
ncbi:MAG: trimeric intracellular cation channel family protein [Bacteroidales bacterium]|nr:trimeric intracellular cation channel family protein [Bacteroidales bacterium]